VSLEIGSALRYGFDRLFERNGLLLVGLFVVVGLVSTVASQTFLAAFVEEVLATSDIQDPELLVEALLGVSDPGNAPLVVPGGYTTAAALTILGGVVAESFRLVADRTLVSDRTDTLYEPTRNIALATVFSIVAGIIAGVAVIIGLVFLVIPGIYIALGLFFFRQEIAVFDKGPIDALADSWSLVKGDRVELLLFALALFVLTGVFSSIIGFLLSALGETIAVVGGVFVGALLGVFAAGSSAGAYRQLLGMKRPDAEFALESMGTSQYGDIDEDWR